MEKFKDRREWESIVRQERRSRLRARLLFQEVPQAGRVLECTWNEGIYFQSDWKWELKFSGSGFLSRFKVRVNLVGLTFEKNRDY